ncbi:MULTISPECIES: TetR/AcrR family transcriptional regulator [Nocardia]|uniref:TetR/AcrR family transcriptional regulator n=1 Tax=Nocardia TaxID=1817 RepID=UPI0018950208|nr:MULTISPECIES: TetR/AcrR family transcriptional regulator [Nocardia]MBF6351179.1 TetR/AcrR family transcriptional regulator [Nocardia flavorosea]
MPVAFTAQERAHITEALRASGHRLFSTVGLKKTSLAELVADAGIVKSTFYAFFDSKEALYLDLLLTHAQRVREATIDQGLHQGHDTVDALRRYLRAVVEVLAEDPLYRRLMSHPDEMALLQRKLTPEAVAAAGSNGMTELAEFIAAKQSAGDIVGDDPWVVVGALRSALLLVIHAEEFGAAYPQVLDLTIDALTAGVMA